MTFLFRCDGGPELGLGHIVGSVRLADLLRDRLGIQSAFLSRPDPTSVGLIRDRGFSVTELPSTARPADDLQLLARTAGDIGAVAVVINFSKGTLESFQSHFATLKESVPALVFMDNPLPPGWSLGDVVINALPHPDYEGYDPDSHPYCFDGLEYFLPDPRAQELRNSAPPREFRKVERVLVAMGGGASGPATIAVLNGLALAGYQGEVDVVVGRAAADTDVESIRTVMQEHGLDASLTAGAEDLPERVLTADLGFSALGLTTYEMAYAGLPVLLLTTSELNAVAATRYCNEYATAAHIGRLEESSPAEISVHFSDITRDAEARRRMTSASRGVASCTGRILDALRSLFEEAIDRRTVT